MHPPFNTGKIKIGCNYQPPAQRWTPSRTEALLQDALLDNKEALIDFDGIWIVIGCAALVCLAYGIGWWAA